MCEECGADVLGNPWAQHYSTCPVVGDADDDWRGVEEERMADDV